MSVGARYRLLSADELAALPEAERAKYRREREAFDREVADLVAEGKRTGVLPLDGRDRWTLRCGRPALFTLADDRRVHGMPCLLKRGHEGAHVPGGRR